MWQGTSLKKVTPTVWKLAASGGTLGTEVDIDNQINDVARIVKIQVYHRFAIKALVVHYRQFDGTETSYTLGVPEGKLQEINFRPTEYITSIRGWIGTELFMRALISIEFETNFTKHGPYTHWSRFFNLDAYIFGNWYEFNVPNSRIIGFHGRAVSLPSGVRLEAIGVYVKELLSYDVQQVAPSKCIWKYGPCGGRGGLERDADRLCDTSRIVKIGIRHGDVINGISVHFQRFDGVESCYRLGGQRGELTEITFGPTEYIMRVRGCIGYLNEKQCVRSMELETNLSNYGPFGHEHPDHTEFEFHAKNAQIIGFHARSGSFGSFLEAIGVYVKMTSGEEEDLESSQGTRSY